MGPVSLAVLFAAHRSAASLVETFSRPSHPRRASRFPRHLLLLSQSLLPRVFSRSAGLCRRRASQSQISGRDKVSLHPAKSSPLFFLPGARVPGLSLVRRRPRLQIRRPLRHRRRHARHERQHRHAHPLHIFLPLASPPRRRQTRLLLLRNFWYASPRRLARRHLSKRPPHGAGLDESHHCRLHRLVYPPGFFRCHHRCEDLLSEKFETHEHDVLVIGAGGAGLRAAIEALAKGASVGVVCKSLLGKAHTVMAEGGIAAAMCNVDSADGWKPHFKDTMFGGKYLNNWRMAQIHAQEAPDRVRELEQWGALFDRTDKGAILQRAFGGHTYKRLCHVGDRTGLEMIRTLQDRGVQLGFDVYMECTITRLLTDGGRVAGAFGYWRENGRFIVFKAKSIVIATGGIGKAWPVTSNSWEYTGDGMTLAYEAGAELMDMEFVQFHPTGMVWPPGVQGLLVTEAVRGEGGILRNKNGERFMEKYDPKRMELSTRDVVARSIYTEVREGRGTEHGGAFLDISQKPADYVKKKLPSMYHQFKELADVDITKGPMEVGPTCHYMMGGIRVEAETAQTTVPGLFAAGEAAAGLHGANRLGGNSLSDLLVFGRRAGLAAAKYAKEVSAPTLDPAQIEQAEQEALAPFQRQTGESPYAIHRDLQEIMQNLVGIFRNREDVQRALGELEKFKQRLAAASVEGTRMFNPGWHLALEMKAMLTVAEAVARSALVREESRGAHSRIDFPDLDAAWGAKNNIIWKDGDTMALRQNPTSELPAELKQIL